MTSRTKNNSTYKAQSNCTHYKEFTMASCLKLSDNNPCSNRPVECELCENAVVWSYGLNLHYSLLHQRSSCPINVTDAERDKIMNK